MEWLIGALVSPQAVCQSRISFYLPLSFADRLKIYFVIVFAGLAFALIRGHIRCSSRLRRWATGLHPHPNVHKRKYKA
jgi:hypothetical protein